MSADTNPGGWPDADKPGTPLNPERDGWHWVNGTPRKWDAWDDGACWEFAGSFYRPDEWAHRVYQGPILTPSETAAREAAAWRAGRDAAHELMATVHGSSDEEAAAIRALTPPADMAAALEAVRREEREACARICEDHLETTKTTPHGIERMLTPKGALRGSSTGTVYAAAIRARGEAEEKPRQEEREAVYRHPEGWIDGDFD